MILDKRSTRQEIRVRETRKRAPRASQLPIVHAPFSVPPRWLRLLLLGLAVAALSAIGGAIGRGVGPRVVVVGQALSPTAAAIAPAKPQPASAPPMATAAPVVAAAPAPPALGVPTAVPVPPDMAAVAQGWPLLAEEHFDGVSERWPEVRSSPSWSSRYQDGGYQMQVDSRPGISYSGPLGAHDFWYGADVRVSRGQAGLFFLIGRPNDFYRLLIDTDGRYQLEWQQVGVSQPLIAWTFSDALQRGADQINQLAVARSGDELTLYANGTQLARYSLPAGNSLESRIGLALDAPDGGSSGLAWFDNLVVRAPKP